MHLKLIVALAFVAVCSGRYLGSDNYYFVNIADENIVITGYEGRQVDIVLKYYPEQYGQQYVKVFVNGPDFPAKTLQYVDYPIESGIYQSEILYQIFSKFAGRIEEQQFIELLTLLEKYVELGKIHPIVYYSLQYLYYQNQDYLKDEYFSQDYYFQSQVPYTKYGSLYGQGYQGYPSWYSRYYQGSYPSSYSQYYQGYYPGYSRYFGQAYQGNYPSWYSKYYQGSYPSLYNKNYQGLGYNKFGQDYYQGLGYNRYGKDYYQTPYNKLGYYFALGGDYYGQGKQYYGDYRRYPYQYGGSYFKNIYSSYPSTYEYGQYYGPYADNFYRYNYGQGYQQYPQQWWNLRYGGYGSTDSLYNLYGQSRGLYQGQYPYYKYTGLSY